jgi:L-Ala-D/L-Glu epimerase
VEIGREAKRRGLLLMAGAMVEARPGICAAAHLVTALGGVEFPDLDTAFLLATDPFVGGYTSEQDVLSLVDGAGLGVRRRPG